MLGSLWFLGDETGSRRNGVVADKSVGIQMKRDEISRTGQGAGAWCRTCCYWFCEANGAGNELDGSIGESGFWAVIERKIGQGNWCCLRRLIAAIVVGTPFPAANKKPTKRWASYLRRDQNNFSFGASSFSGSTFAVCSFQPPPSALYRFTALVSCARRSVISACWALNS